MPLFIRQVSLPSHVEPQMLDDSESSICQACGSALPAKDSVCHFCRTKDHGYKAIATDMSSLWIAVAMLTFPFWGIALLAWANKAIGIPSFFQYLVVMLAVFSPMPIVMSKGLGLFAKVALVFGYCWLAVPVAIFTMLAFGN
jgi:hypothetical protein